MELARQTHGPAATLTEWFAAAMEGLKTKRRQREVYRQTMEELSRLDDRDLTDLGLTRADFPYIAEAAATAA